MTRARGGTNRPGAVWLLAFLVPWLWQCAAVERRPAAAPRGAVPAPAGSWRAAPELQRLVDPYPAVVGPSWLGADVATSVRLTDDHYVWLFGDTLLGSVQTACADGATYCDRVAHADGFIANSIGVMTRDLDGSFFPLVKYWRTEQGVPAPVLAAEDEKEFLWPLAGLVVATKLLVTTTRQTREAGLASHGNVLVVVENPEDPPYDWRYTRHEIPNVVPSAGNSDDDSSLSWATALVQHGDHVYLFGSRGGATDGTTILARFPVADVLAPRFRLRPGYLQRGDDGAPIWTERFDAARLVDVAGLPGTSETTIQREPSAGPWSSYQIAPLDFGIRRFGATDFVGPWRDEGVVYSIPPPWSAPRPAGETGFAAYAAKAHPELAEPEGSVVSYNVNVAFGTLEEAIDALETMHGFYVPQMVASPTQRAPSLH
jgi:hypothetical protein